MLSHEERKAQTQARNPACTCYASDLFHTLLTKIHVRGLSSRQASQLQIQLTYAPVQIMFSANQV
jgi:hypothetical protein